MLKPSPILPFPTDLHNLYLHPEWLPEAVRRSPEAMHTLQLLGPLAWDHFPERNLQRDWGQASTPYAAFAAACLYQIDRQIPSLSDLLTHLRDHPALAWLFGFHAPAGGINAAGINLSSHLPTARHFPRMLHKLPNACLQFLLDSSIQALLTEFARRKLAVGEVVSGDTKHILAWVSIPE